MDHGGLSPTATLVTIRAGSASSGAVFCLHAQAGDVSLYEALAHHLPSGWRVLGLCAPPGPVTSFECLAAAHVAQIRGVQARGPYLLLGECTGGPLAYEVAQQLRRDGDAVELLALIDAFAPGLPRLRSSMPSAAYRAIHRARILTFHATNVVRLPLGAKLDYITTRVQRARRRLRRALAARGSEPPIPAATFASALAAYVAKPYDGRLLLLRAEHLPLGIEPAPAMGWGELASALVIERVPGYFTTAVSEPRARLLAQHLARHLQPAPTGP